MDPPESNEESEINGNGNGNYSINKLVLILGGTCWSILFGLGTYVLVGVGDVKQSNIRIEGKFDSQSEYVKWNAQRIEALEKRATDTERTVDGLQYRVGSLERR
jgi:hypothetical protein